MSNTSQLTLICATWATHMAQPMMIAQTATAILDTVTRRAPLACEGCVDVCCHICFVCKHGNPTWVLHVVDSSKALVVCVYQLQPSWGSRAGVLC